MRIAMILSLVALVLMAAGPSLAQTSAGCTCTLAAGVDPSCNTCSCTVTPSSSGTPCTSDNNACTIDQCNAGVCTHEPKTCGPCQACDAATGNCVNTCTTCEVCDTTTSPPTCKKDVGADCVGPNGAACRCSSTGCDVCLVDCPTNQNCLNPQLRFCSEAPKNPAQATCGDTTCNILCEDACGPKADGTPYTASDCNNQGGCSCKGAQSQLDPRKTFNGPCCQCTACAPSG